MIEKPSGSTVRLDRGRDVAEVVARATCSMPANSDALVVSSRRCGLGVIGPTGTVIAASATQPSWVTPTSSEITSPRLSS